MRQVSNPCSWHRRMGIAAFCTEYCIHWRKERDAITAMEIDALVNPNPGEEA